MKDDVANLQQDSVVQNISISQNTAEPSSSRKNFLFPLTLILVVISIGIVSFIAKEHLIPTVEKDALLSNAPPTISQHAPPKDEPDKFTDWKTYTSEKYNFEVRYPQFVSVQEETIYILGVEQTKTVFSAMGGSLTISGDIGGRGVASIKRETITIGGLITDKFYETEYAGVIKAIVSPDQKEIFFSFTLPSDQNKANEVDVLFEDILSTFRFVESQSISTCRNSGLKIAISFPTNTWTCKVDDSKGAEYITLTSPNAQINIITSNLGRGLFCTPVSQEDICYNNGAKGINRGGECIAEPDITFSCDVSQFYGNANLTVDTYKLEGKIGELFGLTERERHHISIVFGDKNKINLDENERDEIVQILNSIKFE